MATFTDFSYFVQSDFIFLIVVVEFLLVVIEFPLTVSVTLLALFPLPLALNSLGCKDCP